MADQLKAVQSLPSYANLPIDFGSLSYVEMRRLTANQMRTYPEKYAPFLGMEGEGSEYLAYCQDVELSAEWGGHVEVSAMCSQLQVTVWIYEAEKPIVKMGEEFETSPPLRIAYHRHYYALGEHYNSIRQKH
jgi:OTU domain-containing protein 6